MGIYTIVYIFGFQEGALQSLEMQEACFGVRHPTILSFSCIIAILIVFGLSGRFRIQYLATFQIQVGLRVTISMTCWNLGKVQQYIIPILIYLPLILLPILSLEGQSQMFLITMR